MAKDLINYTFTPYKHNVFVHQNGYHEFWFVESPKLVGGIKKYGYRQANSISLVDRVLFKVDEFFTIRINMDLDLEDIFSGFSSTTRNEIKRAEKLSVSTFFITNKKKFEDFLPIDIQKDLNWIIPEIGRTFIVTGAILNNKVMCYHTILIRGGVMRLFTSVRTLDADQKVVSYSNRLLHFNEMKWGKYRGFRIFDFGGIYLGKEDEKKISITKFKKSFGGVMAKFYDATPRFFINKRRVRHFFVKLKIVGLYYDLLNNSNVYKLRFNLKQNDQIEDPNIHRSTPSGGKYLETYFRQIIANYNLKGLDLLDVGCGEGSAMKMFMKLGITHITGIDIKSDAINICRKNFEGIEKNISIIEDNVLNLLETKSFGIYYLYNPFPEQVFKFFLQKITKSTTDFYLFYVNAVCEDLVVSTNKFSVIDRCCDIWGNNIVCFKFNSH